MCMKFADSAISTRPLFFERAARCKRTDARRKILKISGIGVAQEILLTGV